MKNFLVTLFISALLFSCKKDVENENVEEYPETEISSEKKNLIDNNTSDNSKIEDTSASNSNNKAGSTNNAALSSGTFIRTDASSNCDCNCLDIALGSTSELCILPNEIYINARYEKVGNTIEVYYETNSSKTTVKDIPWETFDTSVPIAILTSNGNTNELDWKGFSINGDIAVDYALLGKKNLEGSYKKQ